MSWFQAREEAEVARLADIRNQSSSIRHYTPRGFEKRRAPAALFHSLHSYFQVGPPVCILNLCTIEASLNGRTSVF